METGTELIKKVCTVLGILWTLLGVLWIFSNLLYVISPDYRNFKKSLDKPSVQYVQKEQIEITKETVTGTALLKKEGSFQKNDENYIQFTPQLIEIDEDKEPYFTDSYFLPEDEYETVFGKNNNAFDYKESIVTCSTVIWKDDTFQRKADSFADCHEMIHGWFFLKSRPYICKSFDDVPNITKAYLYYDMDTDELKAFLEARKVNFLGGSEFTDEETEKYKEIVDKMCKDALSMIEGKNSSLTWVIE